MTGTEALIGFVALVFGLFLWTAWQANKELEREFAQLDLKREAEE